MIWARLCVLTGRARLLISAEGSATAASGVAGMSRKSATARAALASALLVAAGVLMAALWINFTRAHGTTSVDEDRLVLGGSMPFWGMLIGGVPNLLIAAVLILRTAHRLGFRAAGASRLRPALDRDHRSGADRSQRPRPGAPSSPSRRLG